MTDAQLIAAESAARSKAQGCNVYLGSQTYHATRSGRTSAYAAEEWMRLRSEAIKRGLIPGEYTGPGGVITVTEVR